MKFISYLLNNIIPSQWISALFGEGQIFGVPLAALFGIPFYINTEASLSLAHDHPNRGFPDEAYQQYRAVLATSNYFNGAIAASTVFSSNGSSSKL